MVLGTLFDTLDGFQNRLEKMTPRRAGERAKRRGVEFSRKNRDLVFIILEKGYLYPSGHPPTGGTRGGQCQLRSEGYEKESL